MDGWLDYLIETGFKGIRLADQPDETITAEDYERLKAAGHDVDEFDRVEDPAGGVTYCPQHRVS